MLLASHLHDLFSIYAMLSTYARSPLCALCPKVFTWFGWFVVSNMRVIVSASYMCFCWHVPGLICSVLDFAMAMTKSAGNCHTVSWRLAGILLRRIGFGHAIISHILKPGSSWGGSSPLAANESLIRPIFHLTAMIVYVQACCWGLLSAAVMHPFLQATC